MAQLAASLETRDVSIGADAWDRRGNASAWFWLPVLLVLCGFKLYAGPITLGLPGLWLPLAAWLGARHGRTGFLVVAAAGLPLVVSVSYASVATAGNLGLYVAALLVCRLYGQSRYLGDCLGASQLPPRALAFLFLVLPVAIGWYLRLGPLQVGASWMLSTYLMLVLLTIGLGGIAPRPVLLLLAVASIAGAAFAAIRLPSFNGFHLGYILDGPSDIVTGLLALWLGRAIRWHIGAADGVAYPGATAMAVLAALLFVASGIELREIADWRLGWQFGSPFGNAILLFGCGLVMGGRGALIGLLAWAAAAALPCAILLAGPSQGMFQQPGWGGFVLYGPPSMVGTSYALGPNVSIAPLEPVYALFGWLTARAIGGGAGTVTPSGAVPPPLRYRRIDRYLPWLSGAVLILAAVGGVWYWVA
jgi:hypothetical protein